MKESLENALEAVELTYKDLNEIANDMTRSFFEPVDNIINELQGDINGLDNDSIRDYMIKLALNAYSLGETKEKSALKAECAEALRKESFARSFNTSEGSAVARENNALLQTSDQVVIEALYNLVASLFKTKMDSTHRVIDTLKTVLMSRNMEAKLTTNVID